MRLLLVAAAATATADRDPAPPLGAIALCVTGQLRTFAEPAVRESQERHLVRALRRQASALDAFLIVSEEIDAATRTRLDDVYAPVAVNTTRDVRSAHHQYLMLGLCGALMRSARGDGYDWAVKTRFDLFFYSDVPPLRALPTDAIRSRMRCFTFGRPFSVDELAAGQQGHACRQQACGPNALCVDDQMALVPGAFADAYFRTPDARARAHRGRFEAGVLEASNCPCCVLTKSLHLHNASVARSGRADVFLFGRVDRRNGRVASTPQIDRAARWPASRPRSPRDPSRVAAAGPSSTAATRCRRTGPWRSILRSLDGRRNTP